MICSLLAFPICACSLEHYEKQRPVHKQRERERERERERNSKPSVRMGIFTLKLIPQGTRKTLILQESCIIHGTYSPLLKASLELLADGCCQPFTLDNQYLQTGGEKRKSILRHTKFQEFC